MRSIMVVCLYLGSQILAPVSGLSGLRESEEPSYRGQPLSHWIAWLKDKESAEHRHEAITALTVIGREAKPAIPALAEIVNDEDLLISRSAVRMLGNFGSEAKRAVPALEQAMKSDDSMRRIPAAGALWRISRRPSALNVVLEPLKRQGSPVQERMIAATEVVAFGPSAMQAVPLLKEALKDETEALRIAAAQALWNIARKRAAIPVLLAGLKAAEPSSRSTAASGLVIIGPEAKDAVPALALALADSEPSVRISAAKALQSIGPEAAAAVPALTRALADQDALVRSFSVYALTDIGPGARAAVPALVEALKDPDTEFRRSAVIALARIGSSSREVMPFFLEDLKSSKAEQRAYGPGWLGYLGSEALPAVPAIILALKDKEPAVRYYASAALGKIGPDARAALVPLKNALQDRDTSVRQAAALALWQIAKDPQALSFLVAVVKGNDPQAYGEAVVALGKIGPDAKAAVPDLLKLLNRNDGLCLAAAWTLWRIQKHPLALPALIKGLESTNQFVQWTTALRYLEEIGPDARAAVPSLLRLINQNEDSFVRDSAAVALRKIDPKAADDVGK